MHNFGYFEEGKVGRISDISLWQRIFVYCRSHLAGLGSAVFLSLLVTGATLSLPRLMQLAIDRSMMANTLPLMTRFDILSSLALCYALAVATVFVAGFIQVVMLEYVGQTIMHTMRNDLYRHLLTLDIAFFHAHPTGRLVTRLTNDIQNMHEMFTSVMVTLFNDALKLLGVLAALYFLNVPLALIMTFFLPLSLGLTLLFSRLARERFRAIRSQLSLLNTFLQESISAIMVLQLFGRQRGSLQRFREYNNQYLQYTLRQIRLFGTFMPLTEFLGSLAVASILWYGGEEVIKKQLTLGELVAFFSYMRLFFQPMRELSQKYSIVQSAMASAERIFDLLDTKNSINSPAHPMSKDLIAGDILFRQVNFAYDDKKSNQVLHDITLHIKEGETIALVGPTGAGKTTLISLLVRFYDPTSGCITVGGHDVRDFSPVSLRKKIGIVLQDVLVEPATVLQNITLGADVDRLDVIKILRQTGMSPFVDKLPEGLDTLIGPGGFGLSAGQKQLLAFARILCRKPSVLLLDEATSSVDTEAENLLEQVIAHSFDGRTSIVIAHRLSTVRRVDRIVVMQQGAVVEQGTHRQLMAIGGVYAQLVTSDMQ